MLFSELYSAYYNTVAEIMRKATDHPLGEQELADIVWKHAFGESALQILPALKDGRWQLLQDDGKTVLKHAPTMPLTNLQKRWLKSIALDPRIRLFGESWPELSDVEPLFTPDDVLVFDRYADGDDYRSEAYIKRFRLILNAIRNRCPLWIKSETRKGIRISSVVLPEYLEYSEKDDKFRLIVTGGICGDTINLGRIISCRRYEKPYQISRNHKKHTNYAQVVFEVYDRRDALERVLLHFAHFRKEAEKIGADRYKVTVFYDRDDETEILIRILSFGPLVRVTAPEHFVGLIKKRLTDQKSCGL